MLNITSKQELRSSNVKQERVITMQIFTDSHEHFYRDYILASNGNELVLLLSTNEASGADGSLEIIRTEEKLLKGFKDEKLFNNQHRVLPNYAHYEIKYITPAFLEIFENHLAKNIEGYHEDCFTRKEKRVLTEFIQNIPLLKEKFNFVLNSPRQLTLFDEEKVILV